MYERLDHCPSCGESQYTLFQICQDFTVSDENFAIVLCSNCQLKYTNPRPGKESIGAYYKSDNYISHTDKANSLFHLVYKLVRGLTLSSKLRLINSLSNKGTLLDYGSGTGDFLKASKNNGWKVEGVEKDPKARKIAENKINQSIHASIDDNINNEIKFDIITLWHVLEHVHDVNETLKSLRKKLSKEGHILIAVPNSNSKDAQYYREFWAAYDVPRHLYHFNPDTLKVLLKNNKLKIKEIKPMFWDSFYVSILSEKNKKSKLAFIKGLWNGLKSNMHAFKGEKEYSSLLFIVSKQK